MFRRKNGLARSRTNGGVTRGLTGVLVGVATLLASGCGSSPAYPGAEMAAAEGSLSAAREVGASSAPKAKPYLKFAQDELAQAHKLADKGETERARRVLIRANADADLAFALSQEASARAAFDANSSKAPEQQAPGADTDGAH